MSRKSFKDGVQFAFDSTSIELAQTCPRKYYYSMIRCIQPAEQSVHLLFGGIYASALELFYKERFQGASIEDALRSTITYAMRASWNHERGHALTFDDPKKTRISLIRTLIWYIEEFGHEDEDGLMTYQLANGQPAVELSFAFEITDDIMLTGHLDRVVRLGDDLYIMDQKTTGGTVGTYYFRHFDLNTQMSQYTFAGQAVLHAPVRGVIIDAAQIATNWSRFERGITTRTKAQLDEWLESTMETIYRTRHYTRDYLSRESEPERAFPMNLSACRNYGGCPFAELCASSPQVRENYIKSDYTEKLWDPLEAR